MMEEEYLAATTKDRRVSRIPPKVWQRLGLEPNQVVRVTIRVED